MSSATQFYISTLLVYFGIDVLACWGLNLQFGVAGIVNFAFVVFQAAGAYTAAILTLGPDTNDGGFQRYIGGANLPFPLPIIAAGIIGAALSAVVGLVVLRRIRSDYQAMVMLVVSVIATSFVSGDTSLVNGPAGLSLVPQPLSADLNLSPLDYQWFYVGLVTVVCGLMFVIVRRITDSPLGRALRAVRDNDRAAASLGLNVHALRMQAFIIGGAIAGVSGALLVQYIGAWAPGSWMYIETFTILTAIIVGGTGNNFGVMLGALMVPVGFMEAVRFLPQFGPLGLIDALQWVAVGVLSLVFLWFRPQGLVPERRRRFPRPQSVREPIDVTTLSAWTQDRP